MKKIIRRLQNKSKGTEVIPTVYGVGGSFDHNDYSSDHEFLFLPNILTGTDNQTRLNNGRFNWSARKWSDFL